MNRLRCSAFISLVVALLSACGQETAQMSTSPLTTLTDNPVERGRYLSKAGNCMACHTPVGAAEFSGGRAIPTPFGEVYSSNLTPDSATGLGNWSSDDFWQALHHGKSRDGRSLYPAFPYPSYSLVSRGDSDALFAYLQTLAPVTQASPAHRLRFPYNTQIALNIWRALYFDPAEYRTDPQQSDTWNRGAYLVQGLAHCGACHTPRGALGNTDKSHPLSGSAIAGLGWYAPALTQGPLSSTEKEALIELLKTGINHQAVLSGPMAEVTVHSLQYMAFDDLAAMTEYLASLEPTSSQLPETSGVTIEWGNALHQEGMALYGKHCEDCHGASGEGQDRRYPALAGNRAVLTNPPNNAIKVLLYGGFGASTEGRPRPHGMPAYAQLMSDKEAANVLSYIRAAWGNNAPAISASSIRRQ